MGQESPNRLCLMTLANPGGRQTESLLKGGGFGISGTWLHELFSLKE